MTTQDNVALAPMVSRSRGWLLLAAGLGFAAAALLGLMMFLGGGADPAAWEPVVAAADDDGIEDDGDVGADETDGVGTGVATEVTYDVFLSRDPFEPVVPEVEEPADDPSTTPDPAAPADPAAPGTPAVPGTPPTPGTPGTPTVPGEPATPVAPTPGNPGDPRCVGDEELVCDGQVVTLIDIVTDTAGERVALVQVDSLVYEVRQGDVFATYFQLRAIDGACVTLLYGDDAFRLCSGQAVLK